MSVMINSASSISSRRGVLLGLAAGLSVAAAIAIVAILTHSFDRTDARLIGTSLGFSVFSALGAAGTPARRRSKLATLGVLTTAAAGLVFALLELAIWDHGTNWTWRAFGVLAASGHPSESGAESAERRREPGTRKGPARARVLSAAPQLPVPTSSPISYHPFPYLQFVGANLLPKFMRFVTSYCRY